MYINSPNLYDDHMALQGSNPDSSTFKLYKCVQLTSFFKDEPKVPIPWD